MPTALVTVPCVAEFGWELMSWQGYLRAESKHYDRVVISSTEAMAPLYADFSWRFLAHNITGLRDCLLIRKVDNPEEKVRAENAVSCIQEELRSEGYTVSVFNTLKAVPISKQEFIRFGNPFHSSKIYDLLVHARNKMSRDKYYGCYNWPLKKWNHMCSALSKRGFTVGAIGTPRDALLPAQVDDLRGLPLTVVMDMMATAKLVVGPSSGPMHLASLCGAPHVVWTGNKYSTAIGGNNRERYEHKWNPFKTPCCVYAQDPDPDEAIMTSKVLTALQTLRRSPK